VPAGPLAHILKVGDMELQLSVGGPSTSTLL